MKSFKLLSLNLNDLCKIVSTTTHEVLIALPSVHIELAQEICTLKSSSVSENLDIEVFIDFSESVFRSGYGDFEGVKILKEAEVGLRTIENNRISFIISDDMGYLLFPESRFFVSPEVNSVNAILMDDLLREELRAQFLQNELRVLLDLGTGHGRFEMLVSNSLIPEDKWLEVEDKILLNSPINPDFQRVITIYSSLIQYVSLSFEGSKLGAKKVNIPQNLLPIRNSELSSKLKTKLEIFDQNAQALLEPLNLIENAVAELREKYLIKTKFREESFIKKSEKKKFLEELRGLEEQLTDVGEKLLIGIQSRIEDARESIYKELESFFVSNPDAISQAGQMETWLRNKEYVLGMAKEKATKLVSSIQWPQAHELIAKIKLNTKFSDITLEDLQHEEFLSSIKESSKFTSEEKQQLLELNLGLQHKKN